MSKHRQKGKPHELALRGTGVERGPREARVHTPLGKLQVEFPSAEMFKDNQMSQNLLIDGSENSPVLLWLENL